MYRNYKMQIDILLGEIQLFKTQFNINLSAINDLQKQNDNLVNKLGDNLNKIQSIAEEKDALLNDIY